MQLATQEMARNLDHTRQQLDEGRLTWKAGNEKYTTLETLARKQLADAVPAAAAQKKILANVQLEREQRAQVDKQQLKVQQTLQQQVQNLSEQLQEQHGLNEQLQRQVTEMSELQEQQQGQEQQEEQQQQQEHEQQEQQHAGNNEPEEVSGQGARSSLGSLFGKFSPERFDGVTCLYVDLVLDVGFPRKSFDVVANCCAAYLSLMNPCSAEQGACPHAVHRMHTGFAVSVFKEYHNPSPY